MWEFKKKKEVFFASACLSPSQARWRCQAGCSASHGCLNWGSELQAGQGWAGRVRGENGGTLQGFGSALIRVIITAGTHTHTHTLALVFAAGVSPDSRGFSRSEVITCPAILHGELRYHSGRRINGLSSLLWALFQSLNLCGCVFICVSAFVRTWRGLRNRKRQKGRVDARGLGMNAGVWAQQRGCLASGTIDYPIIPDRRNKGL